MTTHSLILACRISQTKEPGGLQSTGPQRVRHNWSDLAQKSQISLWDAHPATCKGSPFQRTAFPRPPEYTHTHTLQVHLQELRGPCSNFSRRDRCAGEQLRGSKWRCLLRDQEILSSVYPLPLQRDSPHGLPQRQKEEIKIPGVKIFK